MHAVLRRRRISVLWLAVVAMTLLGSASGWSDERTEAGVPLEFWKGHFDRGSGAFHDWDKEKEIPAVCARCHSANGVPEYLREGKNAPAQHVKNGFACTNCHADLLTYARYVVPKVTFPGGSTIDSGSNDSNLCMTCHQGRESTASVNKAIAGLNPDTPDPKLNFLHVHYFPAGATRFGTEVKVAYEYDGKKYVGRFTHMPNVSSCTDCHQPHAGELKIDRCGGCHDGIKTAADLTNIRVSSRGDFDGNGKEEGLAREIANLQAELYGAIQTYAKTVGGKPIAFTKVAFPYWYADTNANGRIDLEEVNPANKYTAYTPRLLQATYNYTFSLRDPGGAYHNGRYVLQLLYDSLESLAASGKAGVQMGGKVRP
ncbi:MAG TPA: polyheme membrane-associated cytochrome C [Pseudolabrys sp.]|nr:polyheme membrane-associated cytochrome C [Pseudolabrys sp.]